MHICNNYHPLFCLTIIIDYNHYNSLDLFFQLQEPHLLHMTGYLKFDT